MEQGRLVILLHRATGRNREPPLDRGLHWLGKGSMEPRFLTPVRRRCCLSDPRIPKILSACPLYSTAIIEGKVAFSCEFISSLQSTFCTRHANFNNCIYITVKNKYICSPMADTYVIWFSKERLLLNSLSNHSIVLNMPPNLREAPVSLFTAI